jgi:LacI family transcriptional regulator
MTLREVLVLIDPNPPNRFRGIARFAGERGWHLRVEDRTHPPQDWTGDGVLAMIEDLPGLRPFIARIRRRGIPIVDLLEDRPDIDVTRVTGDNLEIGRLAAAHFAERDFRNAAFFSLRHNHTHDLRLRGFCETWTGTPPEPLIWPDVAKTHADDWRRMGAWLGSHLRALPKPLAVFAWNDYDATHVLNACQRLNLRVPDDVAILGVDDNRIICEHQVVTLSSIAHDHERIGYEAARQLESLMSGSRPKQALVRIPTRGVITRGSTDTFAVNDPALFPALDAISANLSRPFGAAQLAATLEIPRIRLDRLFAAKLGHSVGREIARRRIAEAKRLLRSTDRTLSEIARQCGYCHASFLIRTFKKATGRSPTEWRIGNR